MNQAPTQEFYPKVPRHFLTEEELDRVIEVVNIKIYGTYAYRGETRKETLEGHYEEMVEVPNGYHKGHVKLAANRMVRRKLKGIRVREFFVDVDHQPEPCEHKRRVRDFISEKGMRDNERAKRAYFKQIADMKKQNEQMQQGIAPSFVDDTNYREDGLPPISDKTYLA